jgi:hypothetical protein
LRLLLMEQGYGVRAPRQLSASPPRGQRSQASL